MQLFKTFGDQLQSVMRAGLTGSAHMLDPRLDEIQRRAAAGAGEKVPADGGFLVESEFVPALLERMYQTGEILQRCSEMPITRPNSNGIKFPQFSESSRANGSRLGGVSASWVEEGTTVTASRPRV